MTKTLLTLSFHLPPQFKRPDREPNLREDALFKHYAIASGLIDREAMGEVIPEGLEEEEKVGDVMTPASGLTLGEYAVPNTTPPETAKQISLLRVGLNAWYRKEFFSRPGKPSRFDTWLGQHVEAPCACLLLAGHHSTATVTNKVTFWGAEDIRSNNLRFFTAFVPGTKESDGKLRPTLTLKGHPGKPLKEAVVRGGPYDCTEMLERCRLIIIIGCNGAREGEQWQEWAATHSGKKPIILGWHGSARMGQDRFLGETFSQGFWAGMKALVDPQHADVEKICEEKPEEVIKAWGKAVHDAFGGKQQSWLWHYKAKDEEDSVRAGAVDPTGTKWYAHPDGTMKPTQ